MQGDVLTGGFADAPVEASRGFRAVLNALARPGRIETMGGATAPGPVSPAAAALLLVLCDADTPICLCGAHDSEAVRQWIAFHLGAPLVSPNRAAFALGAWADLTPLHRFPIGTPDYPDRSTTLIVELPELRPAGSRLTGPGIETDRHLGLPETRAFQDNRALFPLGHDFFLTCGNRLAGLPRSTIVEAG